MSMTSLLFVFVFLPFSLAFYYFSSNSIKDYVLLAVSLLYYSICSINYSFIFLLSILITVTIGRTINRTQTKAKKWLLVLGIVMNAGLLIYYKYSHYSFGIILPLGISFFTFKAISYLSDVYKGTAILADNPVHDALYLSFFPQVQSGPLSRYNELTRHSGINVHLFSDGVFRFLVGFCKKILLANVLSNITAEIFNTSFDNFSTLLAWLGSICYSLQLLFDFAGYSDMAIGISELFGYQCTENFNYPYMTESVTKFWRRWHISLGQWFRDYIYIPMGGSRTKIKWRVFLNLFVVWFLTGIWHGATWNFVFWGGGYFVFISFERYTNLPGRIKHKWGRVLYRVITLLFINFQWVLFNSKDLLSGLKYIKMMIIPHPNELADLRVAFLLRDYKFFIAAAVLLCFPIVPWLHKRLQKKKTFYAIFEIIISLIVVASFIWSVSFVVAGLNNPFAYANF